MMHGQTKIKIYIYWFEGLNLFWCVSSTAHILSQNDLLFCVISIILIFRNFNKRNIKATWRLCRNSGTCRRVCNIIWYINIQGEHKVCPWLQTFITRKLSGHVGTLRCTSEEFQPWIIFQQDGAPPPWGSDVRRFLDETFPNRWIGRDGPTPWPPRPPDITPWFLFMAVC